MPKQVKYVQQLMETVESKRKKAHETEGDNAHFYVEASKNDVVISIKRDPDAQVEIIYVYRFWTPVLTIRRELSTLHKTGANLSVTLHPGAYSGSDRDCIWNVLDDLFVYQVTNVTARGGSVQLHYVDRNTDSRESVQLECKNGEDATIIL